MEKNQVLKQIGLVLALVVVVIAVIVVLTFVINGPSRRLTSEELALEQTRIALNIFIKQTEVAASATAGLYLTLGVPFPTETPFIVPTRGALGKPTSTPSPEITGAVFVTTLQPRGTQNPNVTFIPGRTNDLTGSLGSTRTPTIPANATSSSDSFWQGEWVAFSYGSGVMTPGVLTIVVAGDKITGDVAFTNNDEISLSGDVSQDEMSVTGTYSGTKGSGVFYWQRHDESHFGGNFDDASGFCGTRNAGILRSRCLVRKP